MISRKEVEKVASLARLSLSAEELDRMTAQMGDILGYFSLLSELDTEGVAPMAHAMDAAGAFRSDEVLANLPRAAALANAPAHDDECYLVPPVFGD